MTCSMLDSNLLSPSLKMEKTGSSTTLVLVYQTTRCLVPQDCNLHFYCCENLISDMWIHFGTVTFCICLIKKEMPEYSYSQFFQPLYKLDLQELDSSLQ